MGWLGMELSGPMTSMWMAGSLREYLPKLMSGLAIVGVGINVLVLEPRQKHKRAALEEFFSIGSTTLDQLIGTFILKLREAAELPASGVKTFVRDHLLTIGRKVSVREFSGLEWTGSAVGLDDSGSLLVEAEDGRVLPQRASEIQHLVQ